MFRHTATRILTALVATATLWGCDSAIYDGEGDCSVTYRVKLTHTKNIKNVDAFPTEVTHVALYAFDPSGRIAWSTIIFFYDMGSTEIYITLDVDP
ncbi:MAG: FimB/Mfa2 family fimbrial subunit, partial [Muribaculum sp.]|nr:FimB/Mfa2 family fimbrial subunit [Muribaculum sp.]